MSAFSRLRYIITANVNALLEKAEDPQKLLRALIREMEDARTEARQALAEMLAEVKVLEASHKRLQNTATTHAAEAEKQVMAENETAARHALQLKATVQKQVQDQDRQLAGLRERIGSIESDIATLQQRYSEALELRKNWSQKNKPGKIDARTASLTRGQQRMQNTLNRFEQLQQQVDNLEARVQAEDEANSYFENKPRAVNDASDSLEIEAELAKLQNRHQPNADAVVATKASA